jgi:large subunit ribosomal protein L31e
MKGKDPKLRNYKDDYMADEKIFTIPLRDVFDKPRTKRADLAIDVIQAYLVKHMKTEDVKIGSSINHEIWKRGMQKPPRKVRIHAIKEDNAVYTEMMGVDIKTPSKEDIKKKEDKKKVKKDKIKEERKERRKKTIQEEMKDEEGKSKEVVAPQAMVNPSSEMEG